MNHTLTTFRSVLAKVPAVRNAIGTGLVVKSLRGSEDWMGPFLNIDHFVMTEPTFGIHPHAGFSAVTVMLEGSPGTFRNRDSLGTDVLLPPGSVHWTQAGSGIFHEEVPTASPTPCNGLQIFVALPDEFELADPAALHIEPEDVPILDSVGSRVRILVGSFDGMSSPLRPPGASDGLFLFYVTLQPHASVTLTPPDARHAFVMTLEGSGLVNDEAITVDQGVGLSDTGAVQLTGGADGLHAVLAGGMPLGRPQVWSGGISTGSTERTAQLVQRLRRGAFKPF
jgi:redox-sensitive bicupin YhaK (pirin superfamily)